MQPSDWSLALRAWLNAGLHVLGLIVAATLIRPGSTAVAQGDWPAAAILYVNLPNDFVWLPFFALYLWDARGRLEVGADGEPCSMRR